MSSFTDLSTEQRAKEMVKVATKGLKLCDEDRHRMVVNLNDWLADEKAAKVAGVLSGAEIKVVINNCFGGFTISHEARKWLWERKSEYVKCMTPEEYFESGSKMRERWEKNKNSRVFCTYLTTVTVCGKEMVLRDDCGRADTSTRTDPLLVECIETLKEKANGEHSEFKIVEVPVGAEWCIEEYDGSETIHERHQVWS